VSSTLFWVVSTVRQTADQREAALASSLSFLERFFVRPSIQPITDQREAHNAAIPNFQITDSPETRTGITLRSVRSLRPDRAPLLPSAGRGLMGQRRPTSRPSAGGSCRLIAHSIRNASRRFDYSDGVTRKLEVGRLRSAVAMSRLTILESAVGASGPTTGASFSILKA